MVTIEVDPETGEIVQASAKCNNDPTEQSLRIIREWARREKLVFEELYQARWIRRGDATSYKHGLLVYHVKEISWPIIHLNDISN